MGVVGAFLIWLLETLGGAWLKRKVFSAPPPPSPIETRETAIVKQQAQTIHEQETRHEIEQSSESAGPGAVADDLRQHWTADD